MEDFREDSRAELTAESGGGTGYLLRSPANANRLISVLREARNEDRRATTFKELTICVGIDSSELRIAKPNASFPLQDLKSVCRRRRTAGFARAAE